MVRLRTQSRDRQEKIFQTKTIGVRRMEDMENYKEQIKTI